MVVLAHVEGHFFFFVFYFVSDSGDHGLFEEDFGGDWIFVFYGFGYAVVSESHAPDEI